ncbi:ATP-dependent helicase HrpB [Parablastomonas sp. CN1-191]|uniref:ATP-dependent helicase HrpB n=1 Tax=Parablastomonas sp. CN1-191 TaxID=3400908 RepID=UPI003BF79E76
MSGDLPIHQVLPALRAALRDGSRAVLVAPPGAGKTTAVAPALIAEPWCQGEVLVLSPRRVAARAAAERMAELCGERAGQTIGYATRLDSRPGKRVTVMTEAIFVSRILADPDLAGVSAVLFDEVHERHLDSDLGLALAIESAAVLREDLRLVAMSATLDGARFAALLGDAPVIESEGRAHPLEIRWLGARPDLRLPDATAGAVLTAWREGEGDILVFLPGVGDIARTADLLAARLPGTPILPLHGQVEPAAQRAAIRRDPEGRRRIVLATNIAETSLTLDGVRIVVDAGLSRRAEFDVAAGVTRLVTHRASRSSATQRAGRAARQGPGTAYRMWEEGGHAGRPAYEPPEILVSDLAPLALTLAQWGSEDPASLAWLDPPPAAALGAARAQLAALGALDGAGRITAHGRAMAALPLDPASAHMLLYAARRGEAGAAAELALLMQERALGGKGDDLGARLDRFRRDPSARAKAARALAAGWARRAEKLAPPDPRQDRVPLAAILAEGYPDRIARRRDAAGEHWLSAGGRGFRLDPASPLASSEWLVIADAQGEAKGARITSAWPLAHADITRFLPHRIATSRRVRWLPDGERAEPVRERRIGAIVVARGYELPSDRAAIDEALFSHLQRVGLAALPLSRGSEALLRRAAQAGLAALSADGLVAAAGDWLGPLLAADTVSLRDLDPRRLHDALLARLSWDERKTLDRLAPAEFVSPAGSHHAIAYDDPGGPSAEVRVQALFGLDSHPTFGTPPCPLRLLLTSPGGRPIQTTLDLPGFWRGSWHDVRKEMKGRYPKHRWPDEPWNEAPSLKTRNAFERGNGRPD